ncbi:MAG: tryptophan-rich sensory protein [Alphaproteobacteria bacterium]|nr:tryptophan-rich sensory protein [Alphaproteobacteria bacterium]
MTQGDESHSARLTTLQALALTIPPLVLASGLGQIATFPNLAPWYAGLIKPDFNPPNWIFGPVWTSLYVLMGMSVWRILRLPLQTQGRKPALQLFYTQLALNAAWSWMFFAAHSPQLGLINVIVQWAVILATLYHFMKIDKWAALLLIPLAGWVSFASLLNGAIVLLNE